MICAAICYFFCMTALLIRQFGTATDVLECAELPSRDLAVGELRVKILAAPINPADLNWIEGTYGTRPTLPEVPGTEAVGEIIESFAPEFAVGTRVIFLGHAHGWQSQRIVNANAALAVPSDLPIHDLAMLKVNPATAWRMLHDFSVLAPGSIVVQNAANSGVGRCVIQIARGLGLITVNMVRNREVAAELQQIGADVVCTDDEEGKQAAISFLEQRGQKALLALNAVGGESALRQLDLLENGATQVTYGAMGRRPLTVPNKFLIFRDICFRGFWLTHWLNNASRATIASTYENLLELMRQGKLEQPVDSVYDLSQFSEALQGLNAPGRRGKILFVPQHND